MNPNVNPYTSPPPPYSEEPHAEDTLVPPTPDYHEAISGTAADSPRPQPYPDNEVKNINATNLVIAGKSICLSDDVDGEPLYSLTHALDGRELSAGGLLLSRVEQRKPRRQSTLTPSRPFKRDVFALRSPYQDVGLFGYEIDGRRLASNQKGMMSKKLTRRGPGWTAGGERLPSFTLRPSSRSRVKSISSEDAGSDERSEGKFYEWRDDDTNEIVAIETRRRWDKKKKVELSPPQLELMKSWNEFETGYLDFLVASWCMHNWRDAKDVTKEPLSWAERELPVIILLSIQLMDINP